MTMQENTRYEEMKDFYHATAFTQNYLFGFVDGNDVYAVFVDWNILDKLLLKNDKASTAKGGMIKIRVRMDSKARAILLKRAFVIATVDELTQDKKYNRGENFERIVTEKMCKMHWEKDSIPYYMAGDVDYNGKAIQVKFDGAELTNWKTYENTKKILASA